MPRITIQRGAYDVLVRQEGNNYVAYDRNGNIICINSNTACIQEAVNKGNTIIASGIYVINSSILLPSGIKIIGLGAKIIPKMND
jgi:hypothetical protein